jgi:ribose-phosphate pyrophosphokinase
MFCKYFQEKNLRDMVIVSPDEGRVKKVREVVARLNAPLAVCYKHHPEHLVTEVTHLAGDVRGKTPIIIEDIIATGGSIMECVDALLANGCKPEIYIGATHGVFSGRGYERMQRPEIREVVVTNTIPIASEKAGDKFKILSVAPLFAEAIRRVHENESINSLFR